MSSLLAIPFWGTYVGISLLSHFAAPTLWASQNGPTVGNSTHKDTSPLPLWEPSLFQKPLSVLFFSSSCVTTCLSSSLPSSLLCLVYYRSCTGVHRKVHLTLLSPYYMKKDTSTQWFGTFLSNKSLCLLGDTSEWNYFYYDSYPSVPTWLLCFLLELPHLFLWAAY